MAVCFLANWFPDATLACREIPNATRLSKPAKSRPPSGVRHGGHARDRCRGALAVAAGAYQFHPIQRDTPHCGLSGRGHPECGDALVRQGREPESRPQQPRRSTSQLPSTSSSQTCRTLKPDSAATCWSMTRPTSPPTTARWWTSRNSSTRWKRACGTRMLRLRRRRLRGLARDKLGELRRTVELARNGQRSRGAGHGSARNRQGLHGPVPRDRRRDRQPGTRAGGSRAKPDRLGQLVDQDLHLHRAGGDRADHPDGARRLLPRDGSSGSGAGRARPRQYAGCSKRPSTAHIWKRNCDSRKRWKRSASSPAAWRTTSTTCSRW